MKEHKPMQKQFRGPYEILASRDLYENRWIRLREDKVIRPGGSEGLFAIIEMNTGASVLALTDDNYVYLVKEYKYGIGRESLELVSGAMEDRESPLLAAKRELREELGLKATEWVDLGFVDTFTTVVHSPK